MTSPLSAKFSQATILGAALVTIGVAALGACTAMDHAATSQPAAARHAEAPAMASPVAYPIGYRDSFTQYVTVNRADERKQVVKIFANQTALASIRDGVPLDSGSVLAMEVYKAKLDADQNPIVGLDGFFVPDVLTAVNVMETQSGWGTGHPEAWRNGEWEYASFNPDGTPKAAELQKCFECHKPKAADGYVFSLASLKTAAGS